MVQTCNANRKYNSTVGPLGLVSTKSKARRAQQRRMLLRMVFVLVFGVVFLLTGTMALARRNGALKPAFPKQILIRVQAGDTLWKIAHRYGNPHQYILERVDDLANENKLESEAVLQPGQQIVVPVRSAEDFARITAALPK